MILGVLTVVETVVEENNNMENKPEPIDIALKWVKITILWLFWLLFYIVFGLELTLVCLLLIMITKLDK